ncbi:MAG: hypothetical protein Q7R94_00965 [bacterium]|nr:hypothetical protein [bacterium]
MTSSFVFDIVWLVLILLEVSVTILFSKKAWKELWDYDGILFAWAAFVPFFGLGAILFSALTGAVTKTPQLFGILVIVVLWGIRRTTIKELRGEYPRV